MNVHFFLSTDAATLELRLSLAESAERVQKLAEQSSVGTELEAMPVPNGRVSPGCSGAGLPGLDDRRALFRSRERLGTRPGTKERITRGGHDGYTLFARTRCNTNGTSTLIQLSGVRKSKEHQF